MRTRQSLSSPIAAVVLFALAGACGGTDSSSLDAGRSDAASTNADGASTDGRATTDGAAVAKDAASGEGGAASDAAMKPDTGTVLDAGANPDADDAAAKGGLPIDLGTAGQYVALAKTGISTVSPSAITGDLGVSPAAATYITGFSLILDASGTYSTSSQVTGKVYAATYASPTPTKLTTAVADMGTAFTAAAGRAPDVTGLGAGSIGGMTLHAGVYGWGTGLLMATDVTLTGSATDVWIFQVAKDLTVSNGAHLVLAGGALPRNIFWQVSGSATLGTTVQFEGTILCQTGIALQTNASITGRLLAQTAVTLDANTIVAAP